MLSTLFKVSSILLLCLPVYAGQSIYITQVGTGADLTVDILQDGSSNTVNLSVGGTNNEMNLEQIGVGDYIGYTSTWGSGESWGGDLDGDNNTLNFKQYCNQGVSCNGDKIEFHIQGDSNTATVAQGYGSSTTGVTTTPDSYEFGGHTTILDIHGSSNTFLGSQRSNTSGQEHSNTTYIYGSNNDVYTRQEYDNNKTINLTINNSGNDVDIIQGGSASHSATIALSGSYATDLDLTQYSGTAQTYSLTQTCITTSGCSVSVTQN